MKPAVILTGCGVLLAGCGLAWFAGWLISHAASAAPAATTAAPATNTSVTAILEIIAASFVAFAGIILLAALAFHRGLIQMLRLLNGGNSTAADPEPAKPKEEKKAPEKAKASSSKEEGGNGFFTFLKFVMALILILALSVGIRYALSGDTGLSAPSSPQAGAPSGTAKPPAGIPAVNTVVDSTRSSAKGSAHGEEPKKKGKPLPPIYSTQDMGTLDVPMSHCSRGPNGAMYCWGTVHNTDERYSAMLTFHPSHATVIFGQGEPALTVGIGTVEGNLGFVGSDPYEIGDQRLRIAAKETVSFVARFACPEGATSVNLKLIYSGPDANNLPMDFIGVPVI